MEHEVAGHPSREAREVTPKASTFIGLRMIAPLVVLGVLAGAGSTAAAFQYKPAIAVVVLVALAGACFAFYAARVACRKLYQPVRAP